jgi:hypothetical protein
MFCQTWALDPNSVNVGGCGGNSDQFRRIEHALNVPVLLAYR